MALKKTVAIIEANGEGIGFSIAKNLDSPDFRLLLLVPGFDNINNPYEEIKANRPGADIELVQCAVDACWEADIILLNVASPLEKEIVKKIKQVATGKIIIYIINETVSIFPNDDQMIYAINLKTVLPHSKIVTVYHSFSQNHQVGEKKETVKIDSENAEALQTVNLLLSAAGINVTVKQEKRSFSYE